jgi:hypothetical protein
LASLLLVASKHHAQKKVSRELKTFASVGRALFGLWGDYAIQFQIILMELAFCSGFIIVICDNLRTLFGISQIMVVLALAPVLTLLAWIKWIKDLWWIALIGLFVYFVGILGVVRCST